MRYRLTVVNILFTHTHTLPNGVTWVDAENARSRMIADGLNVKPTEVLCPKHSWQTLLGNGVCEMCQEEADLARRQFSRIISKFEVRK